MLCGDIIGKEIKRRDIRLGMADSLYGAEEINTL